MEGEKPLYIFHCFVSLFIFEKEGRTKSPPFIASTMSFTVAPGTGRKTEFTVSPNASSQRLGGRPLKQYKYPIGGEVHVQTYGKGMKVAIALGKRQGHRHVRRYV